MSAAITVENLSKAYRIGLKEEIPDTLVGAVQSWLASPLKSFRRLRRLNTFEFHGAGDDILWALRDVSFEVQEGEVIGIIGRNGAGKSTLLKILSRITEPTRGRAIIRGRVSSLLEVGTGFHPELTGRENVYMNGTILGMTKREIDRKFDEIVSFADVEKFLDTPIKRYSSGMQVRLAFAVAAHLEPEILIVDEVLAVGDADFQKKCLGKMQDVARSGRTVLFVSHNMAAVENLAKRTVWVANGEIQQDGDTKQVIQAYLNSFGGQVSQSLDLRDTPGRHGTGAVRFSKMELLSTDGSPLKSLHSGDGFRVRYHYECQRDIPNLHFGLRIFSQFGVLLTDAHTWTTGQAVPLARKGPGSIEIEIDALNLMPATYYLGVWASSFHEWHDVLDNVTRLEVEPSDFYGTGRGIEARFGLIFLPFRWTAGISTFTCCAAVGPVEDGVHAPGSSSPVASAPRTSDGAPAANLPAI
jgi:lipopolysaccharide transport system ATP-binding protein